jgi:diadenosine tetraphosphate (Ap4A) HIT family hydrolase
MTDIWSLHPLIEQGSAALGDLPLSRVLLTNDANYPWLMLVPRRPEIEISDLPESAQAQLLREITAVSAALRAVTACQRINVAALGNVVAQLHVHVIARFHADAAWPKPVWGVVPARPYADEERNKLMTRLRAEIGLA